MTGSETPQAWTPPPGANVAPAWSSPDAPPPPAPPARSGWVTASGVILLVVAAISGFIAVALILFGLVFGSAWTEIMANMPGMEADAGVEMVTGIFTGLMVGMGVISLIWTGAHIAAGVGVLGGRGWARITAMVLAVIGILFGFLGLAGSLLSVGQTEAMMADPAFADLYAGMTVDEVIFQSILFSLLFILPFVIGYLIVLVAMIRNGRFFDRTQAG